MEIIQENVNNSDSENEINSLNTVKTKKIAKIIDSDSENEETGVTLTNVEEELNEDVETTEGITKKQKKKQSTVITSDDENTHSENITEKLSNSDSLGKNLANESDPEDVVDEEEVTLHNKSFPDEETALETAIQTTNTETKETSSKKSLSTLWDSESEEETEKNIIEKTPEEDVIQPKIYKRARKKKTDEPKKMTAKEAAQQRSEIRSESQRMLRECNVSLPYHKPKSYTIKEFLQKRSKLPSALPLVPKAPPSLAMKMSKDQLKEITKKLDERRKEVVEFYKSESESDAEDDTAAQEIRSWLDLLVDNAVNSVEEKLTELVEEEKSEESQEKILEVSEEPMEYEFNLDDVDEFETSKKPNISELIKDKLNIQPKLVGSADDVIDLEEGVTRVSGVKQLVDKFFQHTVKTVSHKHKVELNVLGVTSSGEIVKETVSMNVEEEEEPAKTETPGAKLQRLREELQLQMAQKRLELWKQKHHQGDCLVTEKKPEEEKDILDDEEEEEFEMTESESDEEEEDVIFKEKRKEKSAFLDDEAGEDDEVPEEDEEELINGGEDVSDEDDDAKEGFEADVEEPEEEKLPTPKKKVLRRILKPFSVDSDDEDEESQPQESKKLEKYYTDDDDFITPNLPKDSKTPQRTQLEKNKSDFEFLTPVTYLTGLQNLNSDSKFLADSPHSVIKTPQTPVNPPSQEECRSQVQKNLFPENSESQESQVNIEELADLCSGAFPETQAAETEKNSLEKEVSEELPTTQDLLNLCSGGFSAAFENTENVPLQEKTIIQPQSNVETEMKGLDEEQDQIISQLLDEDEMERFKKKFESPLNVTVRKTQILEDVEEVNATGFIDSDEENEGLEIRKKKQKKLVFSDEEEEEDDDGHEEDEENEEEIDLQDADDDEEQQLENEIAAQESGNFKISDFLDKEAELSESEWGSADEDEKGLDELEFEQGDAETFNENKMRRELERIHMRQVLDEDNRDVKLLQELLLEDGELHGSGRKRQFRWKTLDSVDNGEFDKRDDDDIFLDEEENEEQLRKMRHKREMFLKKKSTGDDDDNILNDSQILKVGQQILKKKSFSQTNTVSNKAEDNAEPFKLLSKRGSFLTRKDQVLQRLAEYNKVTTSAIGNTAKNSKNFVFQTVEANTGIIKENNNKRKASEGTPNAIKKLRLDDLSPAVGKKSAGKSSRAKRLFKNW